MSVVALVGAQYGSEGKGAIAAKIANDFDIHIRTGAPNAGHTYYANSPDMFKEGSETRVKIVARSIPCGVVNPNAELVLGPGALIDFDLLVREIKELEMLGFEVTHRLRVDKNALILDPERHHNFEGGVDGYAHNAIGSTGEGVGPARMAHMSRNTMPGLSWTQIMHAGTGVMLRKFARESIEVIDTTVLANSRIEAGANVLLEGTQGSGLSLTHGFWPYVTSSDANAGQLLTDAGISPLRLTDVILVARTFPIRVAGNSGPLADETSFESIGVPEERTTVTKKVRRIGWWDDALFAKAVRLNGPGCLVALTFADYLAPEIKNSTDLNAIPNTLKEWMFDVQLRHGVDIQWIGTGPDSVMTTNFSRWGR